MELRVLQRAQDDQSGPQCGKLIISAGAPGVEEGVVVLKWLVFVPPVVVPESAPNPGTDCFRMAGSEEHRKESMPLEEAAETCCGFTSRRPTEKTALAVLRVT
ncbi:unnamed protein product [Arctogadus glacialis]